MYYFSYHTFVRQTHANQSLIYLIVCIVLNVVSAILGNVLGFIPVIGAILASIISLVVWLVNIGLFIFGVVNACNKQAKELPIVGGFSILKY